MATIIRHLANWASGLQPEDIPASVSMRARLQQVHHSGLIRVLRDRPLGTALGGADAVLRNSALCAWLELDDEQLGGRTGVGSVPAAWQHATGHTLAELDTAIVAGNEVGGRIGLATLLGSDLLGVNLAVVAASAATTAGRLLGLSSGALAHALALSLGGAAQLPRRAFHTGDHAVALQIGRAAAWGVTSARLASAGATGDLSMLDDTDGPLESRCWRVLRNAFTGLGSAWLTETLSFKRTPGPLASQVAVQGVHEILRRHVKAADKRLRVDQIERIEIRTGALGYALSRHQPSLTPAGVVRSVRDLIGTLSTAYELGPDQLEPSWLSARAESIQAVSSRVVVFHDEERTVRLLEQLSAVVLPLFAGLGARDLSQLARQARGGLSLDGWGPAGVLALLKIRPDQIRARLRASSHDLSDARLDEFQFRFDTEVKLFTTRGGCWPERRTVPECSPGWSWEQTVAHSCARLPDDLGERSLKANPGEDAPSWMAEVLAHNGS